MLTSAQALLAVDVLGVLGAIALGGGGRDLGGDLGPLDGDQLLQLRLEFRRHTEIIRVITRTVKAHR